MEIVLAPLFGAEITPQAIASDEFQVWIDQVTIAVNNIAPLTGTGTPETFVTGSVGRWYVDTNTVDVYYKATGDGNTGWVITS